MIIDKRRLDDNILLSVVGVIKLGESARFFADALKRVLAEDGGDVLIDLSKINYIDSTGIGELVGYLGRFQEFKRQLILVDPSDQIRKLLRVAHLDELFPICDTLEEALGQKEATPNSRTGSAAEARTRPPGHTSHRR